MLVGQGQTQGSSLSGRVTATKQSTLHRAWRRVPSQCRGYLPYCDSVSLIPFFFIFILLVTGENPALKKEKEIGSRDGGEFDYKRAAQGKVRVREVSGTLTAMAT